MLDQNHGCIAISCVTGSESRQDTHYRMTYPEVALGRIQDLNRNSHCWPVGMIVALDTLRRVRDKRAFDGRKADNNGLLARVLADFAESVD